MAMIFEAIRRLVERLSPEPVCEACIARHLDLTIDDALRSSLGELAVERGFERERAACSLCGHHGPVIRKHGRQRAA